MKNYEAFMLDFLEGNLSPEIEREMKAFLDAHPEIMDETSDILAYTVPADENISYPDKQALKKEALINGKSLLRIAAIALLLLLAAIAFMKISPEYKKAKSYVQVNTGEFIEGSSTSTEDLSQGKNTDKLKVADSETRETDIKDESHNLLIPPVNTGSDAPTDDQLALQSEKNTIAEKEKTFAQANENPVVSISTSVLLESKESSLAGKNSIARHHKGASDDQGKGFKSIASASLKNGGEGTVNVILPGSAMELLEAPEGKRTIKAPSIALHKSELNKSTDVLDIGINLMHEDNRLLEKIAIKFDSLKSNINPYLQFAEANGLLPESYDNNFINFKNISRAFIPESF